MYDHVDMQTCIRSKKRKSFGQGKSKIEKERK
jgi:hypothetical protein